MNLPTREENKEGGGGWVHLHIVSAKSFRSRKCNEAGNSLNTVESEPVPTIVLNPNASEESYIPKQRDYSNVLKPFQPNKKIGPERTGPKRS